MTVRILRSGKYETSKGRYCFWRVWKEMPAGFTYPYTEVASRDDDDEPWADGVNVEIIQ